MVKEAEKESNLRHEPFAPTYNEEPELFARAPLRSTLLGGLRHDRLRGGDGGEEGRLLREDLVAHRLVPRRGELLDPGDLLEALVRLGEGVDRGRRGRGGVHRRGLGLRLDHLLDRREAEHVGDQLLEGREVVRRALPDDHLLLDVRGDGRVRGLGEAPEGELEPAEVDPPDGLRRGDVEATPGGPLDSDEPGLHGVGDALGGEDGEVLLEGGEGRGLGDGSGGGGDGGGGVHCSSFFMVDLIANHEKII